jgi:hypothetical protein
VDDEEYFQNLPQQTHLIASTKSKPEMPRDPLEQFFHAIRWQDGAHEAVEQIRDLLLRTGCETGSQELASRWQSMAKYVEQKNKMTLSRCVTLHIPTYIIISGSPAAWSRGIVSVFGVMGRKIESRQGIGW